MYYTFALLALSGFFSLLLALWILVRFRWLSGFLIGTAGLCVLLASVALALSTMRLLQYEVVTDSAMLGTLTVTAANEGDEYRVSLSHNRSINRFYLSGDTWRVSGQLLSVPRFLVAGSPEEYFVVNRIEGRYDRLEDELRAQRLDRHVPWYAQLADQLLVHVFPSQQVRTPLTPLVSEAIFTLEFRAGALRMNGINEPAEEAFRR